jgi:hypothetical protein
MITTGQDDTGTEIARILLAVAEADLTQINTSKQFSPPPIAVRRGSMH